jgi:dCMP deaminase
MCLHAEENAILFVSKIDLKDSTIYITLIPCISCVKKILQCQIKRVVYINDYSEELDKITIDILKLNDIEIVKWDLI